MTGQLTMHEEELFTLTELGRRWQISPAYAAGVLRDENIQIYRLQYPCDNKHLTLIAVDRINVNDPDTDYVIRSKILAGEGTFKSLKDIKARLYSIVISECFELKKENLLLHGKVEELERKIAMLHEQVSRTCNVQIHGQSITAESGGAIPLLVKANESSQNERSAPAYVAENDPGQVGPSMGGEVEYSGREAPTIGIIQRFKEGGETNKQIAARYRNYFGYNMHDTSKDHWSLIYGRMKAFMKGKYKGHPRR